MSNPLPQEPNEDYLKQRAEYIEERKIFRYKIIQSDKSDSFNQAIEDFEQNAKARIAKHNELINQKFRREDEFAELMRQKYPTTEDEDDEYNLNADFIVQDNIIDLSVSDVAYLNYRYALRRNMLALYSNNLPYQWERAWTDNLTFDTIPEWVPKDVITLYALYHSVSEKIGITNSSKRDSYDDNRKSRYHRDLLYKCFQLSLENPSTNRYSLTEREVQEILNIVDYTPQDNLYNALVYNQLLSSES